MKIKKLFICLFFLLLPFLSISQDKPLRVEIEAKYNSDSYVIIPFGENGVILFSPSNENIDKTNQKWYFTLYDTDFKEVWTKEQAVNKGFRFMFFDYSDQYLYIYLENKYSSSSKGNFQILKIDVVNSSISTFNSEISKKSTITGFKVINDVAMLSGYTLPSKGKTISQTVLSFTLVPLITGMNLKRYQPLIYLYDMASKTGKIVENEYPAQAYVDGLTKDTLQSSYLLSIKNFIPRKTNIMHIDEYNISGEKLSTISLTTNNEKRKLNTAKVASLNQNEKVIIGTYNNNTKGNSANPAFSGFSEGSNGIYVANTNNNIQQNITFYNFSKFKSFYSYLTARRTFKMIKKATKLEAKGKEILYDYKLLVHDIIERDSSYIMIAEAYYPEYHQVHRTTFDIYGRPTTTTEMVFDGYRYTNAIIACFNKKGEILWENSFDMFNILTFNLHERIKVLIDGEDIVLAYNYAGDIASKVIQGNDVIESKEYTKIETSYNNDKVINDYDSDMEYWYGNYFISYGYQRIRNKQMDKSRRTVFYFNKIAFQ
ncbi:MAG TPA: hypothetical protein PLC59_09235 [Bacteroidales bacterium]|nr:hypothetical protein [Bacteroidales bacterium]HQI46227.1 hypothetical protein [Bacteroidales bacterium]